MADGLEIAPPAGRRRRRVPAGGFSFGDIPGSASLYSHVAARLGYTTPAGVLTVPDRGSLGGSYAALSAAESPTVTDEVKGFDALQFLIDPPASDSSRMQHSAAASAFNLLHNGVGSILSIAFKSPAATSGTPGILNTFRGGGLPGITLRRTNVNNIAYSIINAGAFVRTVTLSAPLDTVHVITALVKSASPQVRVLYNGNEVFEGDTTGAGLSASNAFYRLFTGEGPFSALDWGGIHLEHSAHLSDSASLQDEIHEYHQGWV